MCLLSVKAYHKWYVLDYPNIFELISILYSSVKTLKSLGFIPSKGTNKVLLNTLPKEKIKKLGTLRVIQKTLVYVIGIAPEIASEDILKRPEYFG